MIDPQRIDKLIVTELPVALFVVDEQYKIIEFNPAAEKITGIQRKDVLGLACSEVFSSNLCEHHCPFRESLRTAAPCLGRQAVVRIFGGRRMPIILSGQAIIDDAGELLCGIVVFRDATDTLERSALQRNLLSLFTHDLKAPVSIVGGYISRLLKGKAGELNGKQTGYLQIMEQEVCRLEEYIHSFLDIAKIESGQIELRLELCEIGTLLHEIVNGFNVQAAIKEIEIELHLPSTLNNTVIDRLQIYRALSNLLDNAIKYSGKSTVVRLRVQQEEEYVILEIQDQGPGISIQNQARIFDHYFRAPESSGAAHGSGLGLAAVKAIVEAHSGMVWLRSLPGEGCTFFISLPISK
ncbi:MAG: PAS domain-containing sensor histidine kinase [Candidatus Electrothrix sp. AR4]|nr:PAS domain-containing sensor histidine kinase [Candidatus Electrothrix sp. AR4]